MDKREREFQTSEVSKNFNLDEVEIFEGEDIEYAGKIPHGWKFCPTDEELIIYYLQKRVENQKLPCDNVINEVRLYESDITDIIESHKSSEHEGKWYFFTNRERKYRGGDRPGRSTPNGFWRATGADINIRMKNQETGKVEDIGLKKSLNFLWGKQNGKHSKSGWKMHEYRIKEFQIPKEHGTKLDDAVLCKIYCKGNGNGKKNSSPSVDQQSLNQTHTTSDSAIGSLPPNQNFSPDSVLDVTNHTQSLNQDPSYMHPTPANLNPTQTPIQYVDPHSVYVPYNQYNYSTFYPRFHYDPHNLHFAYDNGGSSMQDNSTYYNMTQYQPHSTDSFIDPHQPNRNPFESKQFSLHASCCPIEAVPLNYIDPRQSSFVDNMTMPSQHDNFQSGNGGAQQFHASSFSNMMDAPHVVQAQHLTTSLPTNHNNSLIEQFNQQHSGGF